MGNWNHPKTIIGSAAEGDHYFHRTEIEEEFWREIEKGNHILFTAPRRVGKSSVMKYLAQKEKKGYLCIYQDIESDSSSIEFYKRLFELVIKRLDKTEVVKSVFKKLYAKLSIEEVSTTGVKIGQNKFDYKKGLFEVIEELKEKDIKIVIFLDEFPDVINSIAAFESNEAAKEVLHTTRQLRHTETFRGCFTMILAGSIGLSHIVDKIDKQSIINDLKSIEIKPLTDNQALELIGMLIEEASINIEIDIKKYLLSKIEHLLPYYIQLVIEECDVIAFKENTEEISKKVVDEAYLMVLEKNQNFTDWPARLKTYFPDDYGFFIEVLCHVAHHERMTIQEALNIGNKHMLKYDFKGKIDDILVRDGYLVEKNSEFHFLSPFLKDWWKKRYPVGILETK